MEKKSYADDTGILLQMDAVRLSEGYQAAIMAHRGHGKSLPECADPGLVHVEDFSQYVAGLHKFLRTVVMLFQGLRFMGMRCERLLI